MAIFVINEWLWADSSGENGLVAQREVLDLVVTLASSYDQIVVIIGSAFDQKAWACCKSPNPLALTLARTFVASIRQNSDRCRLLDAEAVAVLPDDLASSIKADDHYLVRAQLTVASATLITTDGPLQEIVRQAGLPCLTREEFIARYNTAGG